MKKVLIEVEVEDDFEPVSELDINHLGWSRPIEFKIIDSSTLRDEVGQEPVAWMHEMTEPQFGYQKHLSFSKDNPWSHWLSKHLEQCSYSSTPLYTHPDSAPLGDGWRPIETAPRDGSYLIGYEEGYGSYKTRFEQLGESDYGFKIIGLHGWNPTKWMPWPAAPTDTGD